MTRRIDHLVLAVRDLDAAASRYEQLGFQVGSRNRHPWGTENRLIQFTTSFLELITVAKDTAIPPHGERFFSFGAFVREYLERREGLAMLVLDSDNARADAAEFARAGIGDFEPFSFERDALRPDGSRTRVGFDLAFAADPGLPMAGFFVCQQRDPDAFWNPAFQQHPNGAIDVTTVRLAVDEPGEHTGFLTAFTQAGSGDGLDYPLRGLGRLQVGPHPVEFGFSGFGVAVSEPGATGRWQVCGSEVVCEQPVR